MNYLSIVDFFFVIVQIWAVFQKFSVSLQHHSFTFLTVHGFFSDTTSLRASLSTCEENFPTGIMPTQYFTVFVFAARHAYCYH